MADGKEIFIESSLKERLFRYFKSGDSNSDVVVLYGSVHDGLIHVSSCVRSTIFKVSINEVSFDCDCVPKGIKFLGICNFTSKAQQLDLKSSQILLKDLLNEKSCDRVHEHLLLWQHCMETNEDHGMIYNKSKSELIDCQLQFGNYLERFAKELLTFRIQTTIDICVEDNFKALNYKMNKIGTDLLSESTTFLIKDCNMFLRYGDANLEQEAQTCADLINLMDDTQDQPSPDNKRTKSKKNIQKSSDKTTILEKDAKDVKLLTKISMSPEAYKEESLVPIICYGEECGIDMTMTLPVDVVVMATKDTSITELPKLFTSAVAKQLRQILNVIQGFSKKDNWCIPRPYHFKPPGFSHYITVLYPVIDSHGDSLDDRILELYRTEIHKQLLLPLNRPLLRVCNRYVFEKDRKPELYLINPHESISYSGFPNGTLGLVHGNYSYHHYMQDNFNDDKWGCAYRSLQTIFSWFRHQGYTTQPVPSHPQIQQALVDVGDKKDNFAGSRQWIGSFEVSLCLEKLLDITSKILFVNSGADIATKGRELLHHFETQGTPIMIGGGVLAHTIIGVDYSQDSGDIKFLILDPHYTGGEDLKTVLDKGWCGWKGPGFWDKHAHYNMCMPQRPDMI